jgi:hypothetical protein
MDLKVGEADANNQPTEEIIRAEHETVADAPVKKVETQKDEANKQLAGDTREAAAALLNKYMVRRRN